MPLEIRELIIKVEVSENTSGSASAESKDGNTKAIISECVDAVLEILKEKSER